MGRGGLVHLILTAVFLSLLQNSCEELCSSQSNISYKGPYFTSPDVHLDYVRYGHEEEIVCCGINFDSIDWYRLEDKEWKSFNACKGATCPASEPASYEGGQVLRIRRVDGRSNTSFTCVLSKAGYSSVNRTTEIFVVRCDELARGPLATVRPSDQEIFSFGVDVTFHCEGYFGCDDFNEGTIDWYVQDSNSANWALIESNGTKLIVHYYTRNSVAIKGVNLTVHRVEPQDLGRKYRCIMISPQIVESSTSFVVQINKKDPPMDKWVLIGICVGVALGCVILIGLVIWIVWYCCGPQIKLRIRQALPDGFIGPKTIDDEKYEYNAILYHADEDTQKAEKIKENLEKHGWKIKISADILGSKSILRECYNYCEKSALVMFLYTDNLRNDRMANVIFEAIIEVKKYKKILVIEINNEIKKSLKELFKSAKDKKKVQGQNIEVRNGGHGVNIPCEEEEENRAHLEENLGLLQTDFWKGVSTIKWNKNHENKVLCQIQNRLPKIKFQVQMEKRMNLEKKSHTLSVESQKPLLSTESGRSHGVEYSPPPDCSPGSNNVFFGKEEEEISNFDQNQGNLTKFTGQERVHEDLLAEVHVDGSPKIPVTADADVSHIFHHEGDLTSPDLHDAQNYMEDQKPGHPPARAEYRAGTYGESPATSGYGSLEASGSKSLENSTELNVENYKSSGEIRLSLSQSSGQLSGESRLSLSPSPYENSSRNIKHLLSQSSQESGYASNHVEIL